MWGNNEQNYVFLLSLTPILKQCGTMDVYYNTASYSMECVLWWCDHNSVFSCQYFAFHDTCMLPFWNPQDISDSKLSDHLQWCTPCRIKETWILTGILLFMTHFCNPQTIRKPFRGDSKLLDHHHPKYTWFYGRSSIQQNAFLGSFSHPLL